MNKGIKTIVISGVTRGIGLALATRFIELGHIIIGCGRSTDGIQTLGMRFSAPNAFKAVDVSDWQQVYVWAQEISEKAPAPDLLLNNAGIMNQPAPLWQISEAAFSEVLAVNVNGTANMIRAFLPAMIKKGSGIIVNMSSGWGRSTSPNVGPYCTSKWAIEGLTKSLSQELPSGMATVAVSPGIVDTDMLRISWGDNAGRYISPEKWAPKAADFLLNLKARDNGKSLSI
jgi:NAD(P)-dependent dehydrogenase (short-subunit alcohol dehydrogenase family)